MKILTSREYAGEKEAFVPLIGFKVVSVENGSANVNEFEINGYPKSQKDFKDFISGIVDENVFNMITTD